MHAGDHRMDDFMHSMDAGVHRMTNFIHSMDAGDHRMTNFMRSMHAGVHAMDDLMRSMDAGVHWMTNFIRSMDAAVHAMDDLMRSMDAAVHRMTNFIRSMHAGDHRMTNFVSIPNQSRATRIWHLSLIVISVAGSFASATALHRVAHLSIDVYSQDSPSRVPVVVVAVLHAVSQLWTSYTMCACLLAVAAIYSVKFKSSFEAPEIRFVRVHALLLISFLGFTLTAMLLPLAVGLFQLWFYNR